MDILQFRQSRIAAELPSISKLKLHEIINATDDAKYCHLKYEGQDLTLKPNFLGCWESVIDNSSGETLTRKPSILIITALLRNIASQLVQAIDVADQKTLSAIGREIKLEVKNESEKPLVAYITKTKSIADSMLYELRIGKIYFHSQVYSGIPEIGYEIYSLYERSKKQISRFKKKEIYNNVIKLGSEILGDIINPQLLLNQSTLSSFNYHTYVVLLLEKEGVKFRLILETIRNKDVTPRYQMRVISHAKGLSTQYNETVEGDRVRDAINYISSKIGGKKI